MTALLAASLSLLMIFTALLSGVFGMAGGLILVGVLLVLMPLPQAMVLHAVTQMASNGWRALLWRRHIVWKTAAASIVRQPGLGRPVVDLALRARQGGGAAAAGLLALPRPGDSRQRAAAHLRPRQMLAGSMVCMMLMLVAGVTGPLLDTLFLRSPPGAAADRRHQGRLPGLQPRPQARLFRRADRPGRARSSRGCWPSPSPRR